MKSFALILSLLILEAFCHLSPLCVYTDEECNAVDLDRYLGRWYEIGTTWKVRNLFQRNCQCTQANYDKQGPTLLQVRNTCVRKGNPTEIVGTAKPITTSKLKVSFPVGGFIGRSVMNLSKKPNYQILNVWVDEQGSYKVALVVQPKPKLSIPGVSKSLQSIWILSRSFDLDDETINTVLSYAIDAGYDPESSGWEPTVQGMACFKTGQEVYRHY
jgi:apolipoprotein D and lipocalin family protein